MSSNTIHVLLLVAVAALVTQALRALPFLVFSGNRKMPSKIRLVTDSLPPAVMAVLVVYCVKSELVSLSANTVISLAALTFVILIHLWKKNTLLSIFLGTVLYMILIRLF